MANMTLAIPEELHREIKAHTDVKWSDVARQAFEKKVLELHWMDEALKKSTFTEKEANELGHKLKHEMRKRFSP